MKLKIVIGFVIISITCFAQNKSNSPTHILSYGLEEKNTTMFVDSILSDENTIVLIDNLSLFDFKLLIEKSYLFHSGEHPECEENIIMLKEKLDRIYGFGALNPVLFPNSHFKALNEKKYNDLRNGLGLSEIKISEALKDKDSSFRMEVLARFIDAYSLNEIDSIFLWNKMKGVSALEVIESSIFFRSKTVYVFHVEFGISGGIRKFIDDYKEKNASIIIARKGSDNFKIGGFLSFRNRLKRRENFSSLSFEDLPRQMRFSRYGRFKKKDLIGFNLLFLDKIQHCIW